MISCRLNSHASIQVNARARVFALKKREAVVCFALAISFALTSKRGVNAYIIFALANARVLRMHRNATRVFAVARPVWMEAVGSV